MAGGGTAGDNADGTAGGLADAAIGGGAPAQAPAVVLPAPRQPASQAFGYVVSVAASHTGANSAMQLQAAAVAANFFRTVFIPSSINESNDEFKETRTLHASFHVWMPRWICFQSAEPCKADTSKPGCCCCCCRCLASCGAGDSRGRTPGGSMHEPLYAMVALTQPASQLQVRDRDFAVSFKWQWIKCTSSCILHVCHRLTAHVTLHLQSVLLEVVSRRSISVQEA